MFNEAQKKYEEEKLAGITPGDTSAGSSFNDWGIGALIKINDLSPNQSKYKVLL